MNSPFHELIDRQNGAISAFTFWLDETLYALSIENVLSIVQDDQPISPVPVQRPGLLGVVRYQGNPVTVFDFAARVGSSAGWEKKRNTITKLAELEKEYSDWVSAVEQHCRDSASLRPGSIDTDVESWVRSNSVRDDGLAESVQLIRDAMSELRSVGESALRSPVDDEARQGSLSDLRLRALPQLSQVCSQARQQLSEMARPVILYVTEDSETVSFALRIDDLNNILEFDPLEFTPARDGDESVIRGYLVQEGQPDCLLINASVLARDSIVSQG